MSFIQHNQCREDKHDQISPPEIQLQPHVLMSGTICLHVMRMVRVSLAMHLSTDTLCAKSNF